MAKSTKKPSFKQVHATPILLVILGVVIGIFSFVLFSALRSEDISELKLLHLKETSSDEFYKDWQGLSQGWGAYAINFPQAWDHVTPYNPEISTEGGSEFLYGKEGKIELSWGEKYDMDDCQVKSKEVQLKHEKLQACRSIDYRGFDTWEMSKLVSDDKLFVINAYVYPPFAKNGHTIFKILSTLEFEK